jgi:hypothetical protein
MNIFARKWVRNWKDPHKSYKGLALAAGISNWKLMKVPMPQLVIGKVKFHKFLVYVYAHWLLAWRIRNSSGRKIIIREFIAPALLLMLPIWITKNRSCLFVINHNLQLASVNILERISIRILCIIQSKFLLIESKKGWSEVIGEKYNDNAYVIPYPLLPNTFNKVKNRDSAQSSITRIGFINPFRGEKNSLIAINKIIDSIESEDIKALIVLGVPDSHKENYYKNKKYIEIHDTSTRNNYFKTLQYCDIIIINYDKKRYYYRNSGIIFDALVSGTAVVCTNNAVMVDQIRNPLPVGESYDDLNEIIIAIKNCIDLTKDIPAFNNAINSYLNYRNVNRVSDILANIF